MRYAASDQAYLIERLAYLSYHTFSHKILMSFPVSVRRCETFRLQIIKIINLETSLNIKKKAEI